MMTPYPCKHLDYTEASGFLLTPEERRRFVDYCRIEADSLQQIAVQMEKLPAGELVSQHQKTKAAAYAIVARDLDSAEDMTIGPGT